MKILVISVAALFLVACSVDVGGKKILDTGGGKSAEYSYELSENGCSTGKREFSSQDAYCDGLRDDSGNSHCATGMRYEEFRRSCSGKSW